MRKDFKIDGKYVVLSVSSQIQSPSVIVTVKLSDRMPDIDSISVAFPVKSMRSAEHFVMNATEEEARLYRVFRRKRLPHSLERMRPVMEAFGSMGARAPRRAMTASIVRRVLAGAAAVLALAVGTAVYSDYREEQSLARLYGGSYIIENGRRTDNLRAIHDDIERTLADSRRIEKRAGQNVIDRAEQDVLDNISDPDMRREVELMLK